MGQNTEQRTIEIIVNGQKANASLKEMDAAASVLYNQFRKMSADDPGRGKLIADYQALKGKIVEVKTELGAVSQASGFMRQALTNAFAFAVGGGIEAAIGKVFELGKSIFQTTAKFETYSAVMTNALGSSSLAQKALKDIQNMAAKTPFSVDELTGSFIKFVNRGLTPSMAEMAKMADIAASQGKSFEQLTEAVLDAGTGEFERLKEFGIQASKNGDKVTLSFKGIQKTVANTPEAIQATVLAFGEMKGIAGSTAAISATLEGQLSNLGDTADQLAVQVGTGLRPVFVAILSTFGFFLGVLKELPGFLKENRGLLLGLGVAVLTLNGANVAATISTLAHLAVEKGRAIATRASAAAQWLLNAAMTANPIGLVVAAVALLVGGFITLYERSEKVRAGVAGMGAAFMAFVTTIKEGLVQNLAGLGDLLGGIVDGSPARMKKGLDGIGGAIKTIYYDSGKNAAAAYGQGYDEKMATDQPKKVGATIEMMNQLQAKLLKAAEDNSKRRIAAEASARADALKNEEATLRERLAKVKDGSEQEMRLKQQLITNNANQELLDTKKTAADRRIILAEAEEKRLDLAQSFYEKQAKARKDAHKKQDEDERNSQDLLYNEAQAAFNKNATQRAKELANIEFDAMRKALRVTGSERERMAAVALINQEANDKKTEMQAKWDKQDADDAEKAAKEKAAAQQKLLDDTIGLIEAGETEKEAALALKRAEGKISEQQYLDELYTMKVEALQKELALLVAAGKGETEEASKIRTALSNANTVHLNDEKNQKKKEREAQQLALKTSSGMIQQGMDLLFQDGEARKKHHGLYMALAEAKIMMDGIAEVQAIWMNSESNPINAIIPGWGTVQAVIQTGLSVARTMAAVNQLNATPSYATGGNTGKGMTSQGSRREAVGQLWQAFSPNGMAVAPNGKLVDNSGFAVAGIVHEDEYVVPKWMRADPQVAAVEQWLEARRMRGYFEGGATGGGMSLPAASAAPGTERGLTYAVLVELLEQSKQQTAQLADVKDWQARLSVHLHPGEVDDALTERKQVQLENGIRA